MSGTSSSIRTKLWWKSHWMVLFQNCFWQSHSPTKMATTVQLRCYWKQLWSRWAITGSWEPLVYLTWTKAMWAFAITWRPSVRQSVVRRKLSHLNLLLWNRWTKLNLTWQGWSLGRSLSKLCLTAPLSIQDGCCY